MLLVKSVVKFVVTFQNRVKRDRRWQGISPELPPENEREAIRQQYIKKDAERMAQRTK